MLYNTTQEVFEFHTGSTMVGDGNVLNVESGVNIVNIEITGTSTDFVVEFYGKIFENWHRISAINLTNFNVCSTCNSINSLVQIDLTGLIELKATITTINNGNISVVGRVVT